MGRFILTLVALLLVVALAGAIYLGLFPPDPSPQTVETPVPPDRLQGR